MKPLHWNTHQRSHQIHRTTHPDHLGGLDLDGATWLTFECVNQGVEKTRFGVQLPEAFSMANVRFGVFVPIRLHHVISRLCPDIPNVESALQLLIRYHSYLGEK